MEFLIALILVLVLTVLCKKAIKRAPLVFYLLSAALVGYYLYAWAYGAPAFVWEYLLTFIQKGLLALSFFIIVMFIGVLAPDSRLRKYLNPIRSELSIIGSILACGHVIIYASSYASYIMSGFAGVSPNVVTALILSLGLVMMLAVLALTSFALVRTNMAAKSWQRVQLFAYPFFLLTFVHALLFLLPSALAGNRSVILRVALYSLLFLAYIILRVKKQLKEQREKASLSSLSR